MVASPVEKVPYSPVSVPQPIPEARVVEPAFSPLPPERAAQLAEGVTRLATHLGLFAERHGSIREPLMAGIKEMKVGTATNGIVAVFDATALFGVYANSFHDQLHYETYGGLSDVQRDPNPYLGPAHPAHLAKELGVVLGMCLKNVADGGGLGELFEKLGEYRDALGAYLSLEELSSSAGISVGWRVAGSGENLRSNDGPLGGLLPNERFLVEIGLPIRLAPAALS